MTNKNPADVFWSRVDRSGGPDSCWWWTRGGNGNGYGHFCFLGRRLTAHRAAWLFTYGDLPAGLGVLHRCPDGENKLCVNPAHLYLGTAADNVRDAVRNGKHRVPAGEDNPSAKLTNAAVLEIVQRFRDGESKRQLSISYGVDRRVIREILKGELWRHVTRFHHLNREAA